MTDAFVVAGGRMPIGRYGGAGGAIALGRCRRRESRDKLPTEWSVGTNRPAVCAPRRTRDHHRSTER